MKFRHGVRPLTLCTQCKFEINRTKIKENIAKISVTKRCEMHDRRQMAALPRGTYSKSTMLIQSYRVYARQLMDLNSIEYRLKMCNGYKSIVRALIALLHCIPLFSNSTHQINLAYA